MGAYYGLAAVSGAVWGILGTVIASGTFGPPVWGGLIASPIIGIAVGWASRPMARWHLRYRIAGSLAALYLAAALYGAGIGVADLLALGSSERLGWPVISQSVIAVLWGLTVLGWFVLLWPLSFATHWLLVQWSDPERRPGLAV